MRGLGKVSAESNSFTKEHTLMTKGILIIMMLVHHVLASDMIGIYGVSTMLSDVRLTSNITIYCKMCISGFAFLTAFGMTHSLMVIQSNKRDNYFKAVCKRLVKLEAANIFIYILAVLFKRFVMVESIRELYDMGNGFSFVYIVIDMLGLSTYFGTPILNVTWWYLTFAILLIVAMPFICMAYEKFGRLFLLGGCILPIVIFGEGFHFSRLLSSVIIGTAFAYEGWFEKIQNAGRSFWSRGVRICIEFGGIVLSYFIYCYTDIKYSYVFAFLIPLVVFEVIGYIPVVRSVLKFLGKHATNIFLIHTFLYYYFYTDFIYSFKKDWLILLVMLIICTLLSIVIELLKKISGYNRLVGKLLARI